MSFVGEPVPRWLHRWALFTVGATFVLLSLGAVVTTFQVGMADPIWPTYPWHLLLVSWEEPRPGFLVEHTHRLAGYMVGCCIIVLTVGLWRQDSRRWVRWLGVAALAGVIIQGLLGGFRVKLNEILGPNLALVHGSFASVIFSLLVGLALFTSRRWSTLPPGEDLQGEFRGLRRWVVLITGLVFVQIILGATLRHTYLSLPLLPGHLLLAFAILAAVSCLAKEVLGHPDRDRRLTVAVTVLVFLVAGQLLLGVEALMLKHLASSGPALQALVRTAHVLTGHLTLAASVVVVLLVSQRAAAAAPSPIRVGRLEGVA